MTPISAEAAALMCDVHPRTIRRRTDEGKILKLFEDDRGRTMLSLDDVLPFAGMSMTENEKTIVEDAESGDTEALGLLGTIFYNRKRYAAARKWLEAAAKQGNADAMQTLGCCCMRGEKPDKALALMWIAKAASLGHVIAQHQVAGLSGSAKL